MIGKIIQFELKRRLGQWTSLLIVLALVFQGIWYTQGTFDFYANQDLLMNAPAIFYKNLAGGGILMIIIVAIITGGVLYKDIEHKTSQWVYTLPVKEKGFFVGRFVSAYLINVILAFSYVIGMLLVPYVGIAEAHRFGPAPILQLLQGFALLLMPNLLLLTSFIFALVVVFKRLAAGYLGVLLLTVIFLVMQTAYESGNTTIFIQLADPFGYVATETLLETLSSIQKNTGFLPPTGIWLVNRFLWLGVSASLFFLAFSRFSFKRFINTSAKKKVRETEEAKPEVIHSKKRIRVTMAFGPLIFLKKLWTLSTLEFKNVVRPTSFRVILGIILLMAILQNLLLNANYYIGQTAPLTMGMTLFRLSYGVFIIILLMVWAGELFFKDKTVKIWQITDALPVPVWVTQLSRYIAMMGISFVMAASFLIIGVLTQVILGGAALIDWSLYAYDLLGFNWGWLTYILQIALVFFIAGLTGSRFLTHVLSVGIFFATILAFELGLAEQTIFAYTAVPGLEDYSEIIGYGVWTISGPWYFLMWTLLATTFILLGILFWDRGAGMVWYKKLTFRSKQLSWSGKVVAILVFAAFIWVRQIIIHEVVDHGKFTLSAVEEADAADYEVRYGFLKEAVQPKYRQLDLVFDYYPDEYKAVYEANMQLVALGGAAPSAIYFHFPEFVTVDQLTTAEGTPLTLREKDDRHHVWVYSIPEHSINDTLNLILHATKQYIGLSQSGLDPRMDLAAQGAFGNIHDYLPTLGYKDDVELIANRKREDHGLPRLATRMVSVGDKVGMATLALSPNALRVSGTVQIGTSEGQRPLAPGKLMRTWKENGRNYALHSISTPSNFNWQLGSFITEPRESTHGGLKYQIWSSPKHPFNLELYDSIVQTSYDFIQNNFGNFPHEEVRVVEVPYFGDKFYAYANTIAISEKEGWYADASGLKEKAYLYQGLSSQMIKLWLAANIPVANVQGAHMLLDALPEALALVHLEEALGKEAVEHMIKKKTDLYHKDRYNEPNTEPSLLLADGTDYLEENKGSVELYGLIKEIGLPQFVTLLQAWIDQNQHEFFEFESLYKQSIQALNAEKRGQFQQIFEN